MKALKYSNEKILRTEQMLGIIGAILCGVAIVSALVWRDQVVVPVVGFGLAFLITLAAEVILPAFRWREAFRAKSVLIWIPVVYVLANIASAGVFVYFYLIMKANQDSTWPLLALLVVLLGQRYFPLGKGVKKYIAMNPDAFPEHLREPAEEALEEDDSSPNQDEDDPQDE